MKILSVNYEYENSERNENEIRFSFENSSWLFCVFSKGFPNRYK